MEEEDALRLGTACLGDTQPLLRGEGRITWDLSENPTHIAYVCRRHGTDGAWEMSSYVPKGRNATLDLQGGQ